MQVEYEETPTTFSTSEVLPPQALSEPQGSEDEEQEQDVDDVEEEEEDDEEEEQVGMWMYPPALLESCSRHRRRHRIWTESRCQDQSQANHQTAAIFVGKATGNNDIPHIASQKDL